MCFLYRCHHLPLRLPVLSMLLFDFCPAPPPKRAKKTPARKPHKQAEFRTRRARQSALNLALYDYNKLKSSELDTGERGA